MMTDGMRIVCGAAAIVFGLLSLAGGIWYFVCADRRMWNDPVRHYAETHPLEPLIGIFLMGVLPGICTAIAQHALA